MHLLASMSTHCCNQVKLASRSQISRPAGFPGRPSRPQPSRGLTSRCSNFVTGRDMPASPRVSPRLAQEIGDRSSRTPSYTQLQVPCMPSVLCPARAARSDIERLPTALSKVPGRSFHKLTGSSLPLLDHLPHQAIKPSNQAKALLE